ncbi:putative Fe-S protein YdhL (DUF1289 family) [Vreelandella songnenensis]|uniref:Putative Fe-S protein YdhL (DUF1289 family) n=1 Tax=Vreelandella songnenensis TaxID=1176243 RepID=A0A2T0V2A9_9GAMM|nr:DUF1289 domain-containing protein [Halomonas songnenensis]PRY64198.1 putative Fe-S protein YdhL (DUF1289 family) [Halomonas songnenensis]
MAKKIDSPCTSTCQLKGGMCTSCGRSIEEIRHWKSMKRPEKLSTLKRAEQRRKKLDK